MMKKKRIFKLSRREFVKLSALSSGGLILAVPLACVEDKPNFLIGETEANFVPNVYINILNSGEVQLIAHRSEMGTGIRTSLPLVMADELEADWSKVKIIQAQGDKKYGDQNTDGSYSIRMFYEPMRLAGATVKLMLLQAAAKEWLVDISECKAVNHEIIHSSGKKFGYGYLAEKAALLPVPEEKDVTLKSKKDFNFINKKTSSYDLLDIVTGKAKYGLDTQLQNCKIALIARNPEAGAGIISWNKDAAEGIAGVVKIYEMKSPGFPTGFANPLGGIVVVADNTWAAMKAREALEIEWAKGINTDYNTSKFIPEMMVSAKKKGPVKRSIGNISNGLKNAKQIVEADFTIPHAGHAPMETPCAVANYNEGKCEIWGPVQAPQWVRSSVSEALEITEDNVAVNVTLIGSAFGRKSKPDFVVEAAKISKEMNMPIKLLWTREDDIRHDFYHFNGAQHMEVGIDENNKVTSWLHRSVLPTIGGTSDSNSDEASTGILCMGMLDMPFDIENISCETNKAKTQIRIGWKRSVGNINHAFAIGSMIDQVAEARKMDPIDNVMDLLGPDRVDDFEKLVDGFSNYSESTTDFPWSIPRFKNVIQTVKEKSGWGKSMPDGKGMGFAAHRSFLTYVACVVEVELDQYDQIKITNVHFAVDCGVAVNPDRIKAQFEGGAAFGASIVLKSEITVVDGHVQQSNFDDYHVARITDAPYQTEVHIIESDEHPTGVGEPPVPPMIPALCNAIYQATGKRVYNLPFKM